MELLKLIGITICGGAVCLFLQTTGKRELAILSELAAGLVLLALALSKAGLLVQELESFIPSDENVALAFRMTGISVCLELAVQLCRDAGLHALAQKTELCGKLLLLLLCMPALQSILSVALSLLS